MISRQTQITNFLKARCLTNPPIKVEDVQSSQQMSEKQIAAISEFEKPVFKSENSKDSEISSSESQVANQVGQSDESVECEQEYESSQREYSSVMRAARKYTYTYNDYAKMAGLKQVSLQPAIQDKNAVEESLDIGKLLFEKPKEKIEGEINQSQNLPSQNNLQNCPVMVANEGSLHSLEPDQPNQAVQEGCNQQVQENLEIENKVDSVILSSDFVFKQEGASQMFTLHIEQQQQAVRGASDLYDAAQIDAQVQENEFKQVSKRLYSAREVVNLYQRRWEKLKTKRMTENCATAKEYFKNFELTHQSEPLTRKQRQIKNKLLKLCTKPRLNDMKLISYEAKGTMDHITFFQSPEKVAQCNLCYKYATRVRKDRHEDCFASQNAYYYRYISFNDEYSCLICFNIAASATEMATHMSNFHHPLDLKFFGYNLHILQRTDQVSFDQMTKEVTGSEKKVLAVKDFNLNLQRQFHELGTHLASEQPFLSMLQPLTEHLLSFQRPLETDHFVQVSGNKVAIIYSTTLFKHAIYGGFSYDEMVQAYLKLGLCADSGFYKTAVLEQTTDTFAFVGKFAQEKVRQQLQPIDQWLDDNINTTATVFISMIDALSYLLDKGILVIQGMQIKHWHYDIIQNRAYFLAPHWFQNDLMKANQVGHWRIQFSQSENSCHLKGVWGNYSQIVCALYIYLSTKTGYEHKVAQLPLNKYQRAQKLVYRDLFDDFKEAMQDGQRIKYFRPFIKMTKLKSQDPAFYKRTVKYVCKVFNNQATTQAQDREFSLEEITGKKRDMKAEERQ